MYSNSCSSPARALHAVAATALLCGLPTLPSGAAEPETAATPPGQASVSMAIAGEQIPVMASAAQVTLDSIAARLSAPVAADGAAMAALAESIDRLHRQPDFDRLGQLPEFRVAELQRYVGFYQSRLADAEQKDVERAARLSADAVELAQLRETWQTTLDAAEKDQLSRPLIEEARRVLAQAARVAALLDPPLAAALASRERAGRQEARLQTLQRTLQEAARRAADRRLTRDVAPIFSSEAFAATPDEDWDAVRTRLVEQLSFGRDYYAAQRRAVEAFVIVALLLFAAVIWLRRRAEWLLTAGEPLPDASRVLKRPFSSLLLLLMVFALLASEFAPAIFQEILAVSVMLVLLRLMPGRLVAGHYLLLVGLAALFVLDRARVVMPYDSLAFRLDQLLVSGGLAIGYARALWLYRHGSLPAESWLALLARVAPLAIAMVLAAIVANLLGNVSLADLLVRGTLASTYGSAVLFAAAFIVDDFLAMLVRSRAGIQLRMVTLHGELLLRTSRRLVHFAAIAAWLYITLVAFQLWTPVAARLAAVLAISWSFGQLSFTLGGILTFFTGVLIAVFASRTVRFLLSEEILSRTPWPAGAKSTTATLTYYAVLLLGLLLALSAAGIQTTQFALVFGALGVGIGFGLQTVVNNFVSGLILMFERPIQPGDIVDVDSLQGRVIEIGLRATRVRTWEGAEVVVPNGTLLSGNLINWTLSDSNRRIDVTVGVAYGSDIRRVLEILKDVAQRQPTAMSDPAPVALFSGFGDSSLDFVMRFWTRDAALTPAAHSEACTAVAEALQAAGIEIPFPQRDLHLRSVDAAAAQSLR